MCPRNLGRSVGARRIPALIVAAVAASTILSAESAGAAHAGTSAPTTYYVDQVGGSNNNAGTSPSAAWKDFTKLNAATLHPGDVVQLKRGSVWTNSDIELGDGNGTKDNGTATSPIVITSYGTGSAPTIDLSSRSSDDGAPIGSCIWLDGSYIEVDGIAVANCKQNGIQLVGSHEALVGVDVAHNAVGVEVEPGSDYDTITGSQIHDNTRMMVDTQGTGCGTEAASQCDDDYGAEGIAAGGDHTTITGNGFARNAGSSHDYGRDGSAVEVFGAEHTIVSHNTSTDDAIFSEIGGLSAARNGGVDNTAKDTEFAYNLVTGSLDGEGFLVLNADASNIYGPSYGTIVDHNTIYYTGGTLTVPEGSGTKPQRTFGWQCGQGCDNGDPTTITVFGNIIDPVNGWAEYCEGSASGACKSDYNVIPVGWDSTTSSPGDYNDGVTHVGDVAAPPGFTADGTDFTLTSSSPAVDHIPASATSGGQIWTTDLAGNPTPVNGNADAGAYERQN